jgi:RNA polymerase sigma factor (sigma-70 family)
MVEKPPQQLPASKLDILEDDAKLRSVQERISLHTDVPQQVNPTIEEVKTAIRELRRLFEAVYTPDTADTARVVWEFNLQPNGGVFLIPPTRDPNVWPQIERHLRTMHIAAALAHSAPQLTQFSEWHVVRHQAAETLHLAGLVDHAFATPAHLGETRRSQLAADAEARRARAREHSEKISHEVAAWNREQEERRAGLAAHAEQLTPPELRSAYFDGNELSPGFMNDDRYRYGLRPRSLVTNESFIRYCDRTRNRYRWVDNQPYRRLPASGQQEPQWEPMSQDAYLNLMARARAQNPEARKTADDPMQEALRLHAGIVIKQLSFWSYFPHAAAEDLISAGDEALWRAVQTWDPEQEPFPSYATGLVRFAMLRVVQRSTGVPVPRKDAAASTLSRARQALRATSALEPTLTEGMIARLLDAANIMPGRYVDRYGASGAALDHFVRDMLVNATVASPDELDEAPLDQVSLDGRSLHDTSSIGDVLYEDTIAALTAIIEDTEEGMTDQQRRILRSYYGLRQPGSDTEPKPQILKEIAAAENVSVQTVANRLKEAHKIIRRGLREAFGEIRPRPRKKKEEN